MVITAAKESIRSACNPCSLLIWVFRNALANDSIARSQASHNVGLGSEKLSGSGQGKKSAGSTTAFDLCRIAVHLYTESTFWASR